MKTTRMNLPDGTYISAATMLAEHERYRKALWAIWKLDIAMRSTEELAEIARKAVGIARAAMSSEPAP
jgi:hypothetical protein